MLTNASIYTLNDSSLKWAQAIVFDNETGLIESVGTQEQVLAASAKNNSNNDTTTTVVDLQGRLVLPGFQDAHLHAVEAGINANLCLLDQDAPVEEWKDYFFVDPEWCPSGGPFGDQGWIVGAGLDLGILQETIDKNNDTEYPITVLDQEYPTTPVYILDSLGHGAIANSAAMKAVGYDILQGDPPGGILMRDPDTGNLTGIVLENAQQRFRDAAFPPTAANQQVAYESLLDALALLNSYGITSVSDAGGFWRQAQTEAWARAENDGLMTVRASNALYIYPDQPMDEQLPELLQRYSNDPNKLVRFDQAKIYVDGILSLTTSALYEPYDQPRISELGFEYFDNRLQDISTTLANAGFQLHFHVTGDRGAGLALDAIEASDQAPGPHRLTHCYLVDERDRGRFAQDNVIADLQSAPSSIGKDYVDFIDPFIGSTRANQVIPLKELHDAGATITLSSDWDADELSPLSKLQAVLTRSNGNNLDSLETALPMVTKNVAELLKTNTGSLEPGKFADLVVLDQDIFVLPFDKIAEASVLVTVFNGKVVYDPTGLLGPRTGKPPPESSSFYMSKVFSIVMATSAVVASIVNI